MQPTRPIEDSVLDPPRAPNAVAAAASAELGTQGTGRSPALPQVVSTSAVVAGRCERVSPPGRRHRDPAEARDQRGPHYECQRPRTGGR